MVAHFHNVDNLYFPTVPGFTVNGIYFYRTTEITMGVILWRASRSRIKTQHILFKQIDFFYHLTSRQPHTLVTSASKGRLVNKSMQPRSTAVILQQEKIYNGAPSGYRKGLKKRIVGLFFVFPVWAGIFFDGYFCVTKQIAL